MSRRPVAVLAALLLAAALTAPAAADSWMPFAPRRVVSPEGKHYVVAHLPDGKLRLELCRRRAGAPPMQPARWKSGGAKRDKPSVIRDPADEVVFSAVPVQTPLEIQVLDGEPAVVLFEKYANVGYGRTLALLDAKGEERWALRLHDLFDDKTRSGFRKTVSSIWWSAGWWVDEKRESIVLVTHGGVFREVAIADGKVSPSDKQVLLTRFGIGPVADRMTALELAAKFEPAGMADAARQVALDEFAPPGLRMRAAVAVKVGGGGPLAAKLFEEHAGKDADPELRKYAVAHLTEIFGKDALPALRAAMRGTADEAWGAAQRGFVALGEASVGTLVEMLGEKGQSSDYRGGAAHALKKIGSAKALPALLLATADADDYTANAAVNAAIAIGAPDLSERLAAILEAGSTQDARIASYFRNLPTPAAVGPLLAALDRSEPDSYGRRTIVAALEKCSGKSFGDDPKAWREGLGR